LDDLERAFARLREAARGLPEVTKGASYGTPSMKVRNKFLCRLKDAATLVVMCPPEEKEMLMAAAPGIYFETDHYKGWPAVLIRAGAISDEELRHRLKRAWLMQAPKTLVKALQSEGAGPAG
jgi:hypothetical protein